MKLFQPTSKIPVRLKNTVRSMMLMDVTTTVSEDASAILFPWIIFDGIVQFHSAEIPKEWSTVEDKEFLYEKFNNLQRKAMRTLVCGYFDKLIKRYPQCSNKKMIVLVNSDYSEPYWETSDFYFFRTSLYRSKKLSNEAVLPYLYYKEYNKQPELAQNELKPSIGFCGSIVQGIRKQLIFAIMNDERLNDNFIGRSGFFHSLSFQSQEHKQLLQKEYFNNLRENLFIVCCRGAGNYSIRFYETLQAGRIPILIDSDISFPLADEIKWDDVVICKPTAEEVIETVLDWYQNRDLIEVQKNNRKIWEQYLSREGFSRRLINRLPDIIER